MRNWIAGVARVRLTALVAGIAIGAGGVLVLPAVASAETREFVGKVIKISETKIVVKNRRKDRMDFIQGDSTVVEGDKNRWKDIQARDRVSVTWDIVDKPRQAYQIKVMPPEKDTKDP
jgi:hypothetical protein